MATEITEDVKRLMELTILNAKPLLNQYIAQHSYAAIVELKSGNIIHSTAKINELFGYPSLEGKNIKDLMPGRYRDKHDGHLTAYASHPVEKTMGERNMNLYGLHAAGHEFEVAILLSPLPDFMDGRYAIFQVMRTKNN
jgi:rsbT co-antagonist protein RsbR